jgi:hypothetical protein
VAGWYVLTSISGLLCAASAMVALAQGGFNALAVASIGLLWFTLWCLRALRRAQRRTTADDRRDA